MLDMFMFARLCVPEANDWRSSVDVNCHNWPIIGYTRKRYTVIFTTLSLPSPYAIFAYFFSTRFPQTFPTILEPGTGYLSISLIFRHSRSFAVPSLPSPALAEESEGTANDLGQGTVEPRSTDTSPA